MLSIMEIKDRYISATNSLKYWKALYQGGRIDAYLMVVGSIWLTGFLRVFSLTG